MAFTMVMYYEKATIIISEGIDELKKISTIVAKMNLISSSGQDCWNIAKRSVCICFKGEMKVYIASIVPSFC